MKITKKYSDLYYSQAIYEKGTLDISNYTNTIRDITDKLYKEDYFQMLKIECY